MRKPGIKSAARRKLNFRHFRDLSYHFEFNVNNMLLMNTKENSDINFYGKVYGTGMNYFNIISGYGFTIEVSQKLHKKIPPNRTPICGLEHVGLQVSDLSAAIQFYENLGFTACFDPVVNYVDGHTILCCMVAASETVIEIYKFHDLPELSVQRHPVIERLILGGNGYLSGTALERVKFMEEKACTI